MTYQNLDLLFERSGGHYRVRVLDSPAGQATCDFILPFSDSDLENFFLLFGRSKPVVRRGDSGALQALKNFGGRLFETVFTGEVRGLLQSSLDETTSKNQGLRLRLRLTDVPELADLPWEFLYNPARDHFLSLSNSTPIVRFLDIAERIKPLTVQLPIRVLVMISDPNDRVQLDVEREWSKLKEAVRDLESEKRLIIDRLDAATLPALQTKLQKADYHIFHYIGHGEYDEPTRDGALILEDEQQLAHKVRGKTLGTLLRDCRSLRFAVLNACEGARTSLKDPFAGVAHSLMRQGLSAVVAMQFEITDAAAITFAHSLYTAIANNYPADAALAEARKAIYTQGNEVEWGTPVLYMRSPDGRIFDVETAATKPKEEKETQPPETKSGADKRKRRKPPSINQVARDTSGQVIQAGRDVVIGRPNSEKGLAKKLALWLGILSALVTIATFVWQFWPENSESARYYGVVLEQSTKNGIAGAEIEIKEAANVSTMIGQGRSHSNGEFSLLVKARPGSTVWVSVKKDGYKKFFGMKNLSGNDVVYLDKIKRQQ